MFYRLIVLTGRRKGERITIGDEPITIGRDARCEIWVDDADVALRHARIEEKGDSLRIQDLESMGKIVVNNHEVSEAKLKHGDVVSIGRTRFLVEACVEAEVARHDLMTSVNRGVVAVAYLAVPMAFLVIVALIENVWLGIEYNGITPFVPQVAQAPLPASNTLSIVERPSLTTTNTVIAASRVEQPTISPDTDRPEHVGIATNEKIVDRARIVSPTPPRRTEPVNVRKPLQAGGEPSIRAPETETGKPLQVAMRKETRQARISPTAPTADASTGRAIKPVPDIAAGGMFSIEATEHTRFQESDDFDEMRVVEVQLKSADSVREVASDSIRVDITFFDMDARTGRILPTRAVVSKPVIDGSAPWRPGETRKVTGSYVVPKGFRGSETNAGRNEQFYGYVVRVYYNGTLQDEDARPVSLINFFAGESKDGGTAAPAGPRGSSRDSQDVESKPSGNGGVNGGPA